MHISASGVSNFCEKIKSEACFLQEEMEIFMDACRMASIFQIYTTKIEKCSIDSCMHSAG